VSRPSVIWVLSAANLWLWHLPPLYDLTLSNHLVHHLEHTLFLVLGIAFWAHLIDQRPFRAPLGTLERAGYVFLTMVASRASFRLPPSPSIHMRCCRGGRAASPR